MDDGTICRLDDDSFYVTTTSSGAGAVEEWFGWWLADWGMQVHMTDVTQALVRGQPGRPARARDHGGGHRPRLLGRGVHLPRRQAGARRRRAVPDPADRLRRRGRLRDPLPGGARRAPLGGAARGRRRARRCGRSGSSRSASCACRSCTSSSGRTPTPSRRRSAPRCRGSSSSTRSEDFIGRWALERYGGAGARDRARRLHDGRRSRADRGRRGGRPRRGRGRPRHVVALVAAARAGHRDGVGAGRAGRRRRRDHDLRRRPARAAPRS